MVVNNKKFYMTIWTVWNLLQFLSSENINSFSQIYDYDGNGKCYSTGSFEPLIKIFLEKTSLILKQAEWNIIKMGNDKFLNKCKRVHFKNIAIESKVGNWKFEMF